MEYQDFVFSVSVFILVMTLMMSWLFTFTFQRHLLIIYIVSVLVECLVIESSVLKEINSQDN